ncbi:MAG: UDP-N-acetylmuramoyl-L-alanyl-D-glutamate--2,6-diaminopimelate ligase [Kiritimatiellae bacterium]|jgi:UDP-N-acetylmuramoyl-L-alanyl-D-glutamate--2,6-diaminopimelate ligase|nr:UDP-N-acetylmuramoyl-L-alanyl-D-glutamate--2,6-diaminopimelate ligase [Kiritimatiellia bacterium]
MSPKPISLTSTQWMELLGATPPGSWPKVLTGVQPDSRRVRQGDLFVAIDGVAGDGHRYVQDAIRRGAAGLVTEHPLSQTLSVPEVVVPDSRAALAWVSRALFECPDEDLRIAAITGTNGKTSVAGYVHQLLQTMAQKAGLLGTVSYRFGMREIPARRTTPGAPELHEFLRSMVEAGCTDCVMEVSSHALDQKRVLGLNFHTGVFTNLSQDHLDYHSDMEAYFQTKVRMFREYNLQNRLVGEDEWSQRVVKELGANVLTCGLGGLCDVRASNIHLSLKGSRANFHSPWGEGLLQIPQPGEYNLRNALQALAVVAGYGFPVSDLLKAASGLQAAPGRLQRIPSRKGTVFVDYAHTPDALHNVLGLLRGLSQGRLLVVFGCGGDRDRSKRPLMVQAAAIFADELILTLDNPRTEDPDQIFADMKTGLKEDVSYQIVEDRAGAIEKGVQMLQQEDILLIAGKGHETVQQVGALQLPFDDREVVAKALAKNELSKSGAA